VWFYFKQTTLLKGFCSLQIICVFCVNLSVVYLRFRYETDRPAVSCMECNATMNSRSVKKWQVFPGRNNFCCDGRIIMGAFPWIFYFTCVLIIVTNGLFFGVEYVLIYIVF